MEAQVPFSFGLGVGSSIVLLVILVVLGVIWWVIRGSKKRLKGLSDAIAEAITHKTLELDGLHIHYTQEGKGKDLLLIHGIGASTYTWRLLVPHLSKNFRVTVIDLPGFGKSSKNPKRDHGLEAQSEVVIKILDHLKISKVTLVGSSMGGAIALWLAKHNPERIAAVAVLAPATHPKLLPLNVTVFSKVFHPTSNILLTRTLFRQILKRVVSRHELIDDDVIDNYLRPYVENGASVQTFIRATSILSDKRLPEALRGIQVPVLILYGEKDQMVPMSVIYELQKRIPHATLITHPTAGHHPQEDESEWVASEIKQHFL